MGLGKACNAKLVAADDVTDPEPGTSRRLANLRCCAGCGSTRVRPTSTCGCVAYWYCEACALGWSELARVHGWSDLNVKLACAQVRAPVATRAAAG